MLHFRSRITLCVNITYLLQLQSSLEGDRELVATSEVQEVGCIQVPACQLPDLIVHIQHLVDQVREPLEPPHQSLPLEDGHVSCAAPGRA